MSGLFGTSALRSTSNTFSSATSSSSIEINLSNDRVVNNGPEDSISDISFSPQAELLSVASWDKKVRIYEVMASGDTQGRAMYEHQGPVLSGQWFGDGSKVISGGCDNAIRAYDLQSGQSAQVGQHDSPVSSVRCVSVPGAAGPMIASCSWDKTLKYWDMRQQQPVSTIQLPERAYTMDTAKSLLVVGTAERHICIIDLTKPGEIFKTILSPLKWQTRVVSCYPSGNGYAIGSIEGRCAIQYVDPNEQTKSGFSFRCHRQQQTSPRNESIIYAVNAISLHPVYGTFTTAGSDGTFHVWDKDARHRLKGPGNAGGPITATAFNRNGSIFAYAVSYDWSKGFQFNTANHPNVVKLHPTTDEEVKQKKR